eukprot:c12674_g1_i2.p1 GENE.c12674_g1_i2~~c12674_g1_i2.p1  ORF type:complete len:212 (-),score=39.80 c12674_g1_i2:140-751(-)
MSFLVRRVYSGMQPTGTPHLGNYVGAITQWLKMQKQLAAENADRSQLLLCAVDLHALTSSPDPVALRTDTVNLIASLLACGLDTKHCILYQQSMVPEHSELAWILSCTATMGRLNRMTQFKDKVGTKSPDQINLGLYSYPVLMAADILLFQATHVPVGEDQKQHLELTKALATSMNTMHPGLFTIPETVLGLKFKIPTLRRIN